MTNKVLSPDDQQWLGREFEKVEERIGRDTYQWLKKFAERLAQETRIGQNRGSPWKNPQIYAA